MQRAALRLVNTGFDATVGSGAVSALATQFVFLLAVRRAVGRAPVHESQVRCPGKSTRKVTTHVAQPSCRLTDRYWLNFEHVGLGKFAGRV